MHSLKKYPHIFILILAILLGIFFRFYKLGESPQGFYLDEAAMGYDAYSILETGKDEYGMAYPAIFRSFGDFKTPIYTYMIVPLIPIFGLTVFVTRLPSAFFGVLTLPLLYFLLRKLSPKKYINSIPALATLFLALSPWHIIFSRTAYETNLALFFLLLGTYMFLKSLQKPWMFIFSSLSFAISFMAYHAERLVVPILVISLATRYKDILISKAKSTALPVILSVIIGAAIITPTVLLMRTPGFLSRTTTLNIFSYSNQMPPGFKEATNSFQKLINVPQFLTAKEFLSLYISYFSPRYLFSIGDSGPRSSYPDLGTFFIWQFPLYLVGFYFFIKDKDLGNLRNFVFVLLLASPIPAALTRDPYSTIRSLPMVVPLSIMMALGLTKLFMALRPNANLLKSVLLGLVLIYSSARMFISIFYLNDYFRSQHWDYGWERVVESFADLDPTLPIVVDNSRGEPYIHLLFFLKHDPSTYQKDNYEVPLSQYYTNMSRNLTKNIGRVTSKKLEWGKDTDEVEQYIVADGLAVSNQQIEDHHMTLVDEIGFINGEVAFRIIKTNPQ